MKSLNITVILLIVCTHLMSCNEKEENDNSTFRKVNEGEFLEIMNVIEIRTVQLLNIKAGSKAYLFRVKDSVSNEQYFITSPRAAFYEQHGVGVPNYYNQADSIFPGGYFEVITSPGKYKSGLHESSTRFIIFDKDTLSSFSNNEDSLPLYHGENLFELTYSKK